MDRNLRKEEWEGVFNGTVFSRGIHEFLVVGGSDGSTEPRRYLILQKHRYVKMVKTYVLCILYHNKTPSLTPKKYFYDAKYKGFFFFSFCSF